MNRFFAAASGPLAGCLFLLAGCASPEPAIPPTPLTPIISQIDAASRWSVSLGDEDKRGLTRFVPLVSAKDNTVYAASIDGNLVAADLDSGKVRWRRKLGRPLTSGVGGDDEQLYVADRDGIIIALDRENGKTRWEYTMTSAVLAPVAAGFGAIVVRSADGRIAGLNAEDGTERWSNTYTPPALTVHGYGQPILLGDGVLLGLDDGKVVALSLDAGRVLWESTVSFPAGRSEVERLVDVDADILVDNTSIYAANYQGALVKLEPARGRPLWSTPFSTTAGFTQLDDVLVAVDSTDRVVALSKDDGTELWDQSALVGRRLTQPVVVGDVVLVADFEGFVHLLSTGDGSLVGRLRAGDEPVLQLIAHDEQSVLLQTRDGRLRSIRVGS
ncbi:MAG: outer membrane protein assembly factor BamB [Gammaproteobacteria bacterium]|nr:outer membrane protein assembly factor BamB [Gammaproteobacteria bacterium]